MLLFVFLALACSIEASQTYYTAAVVEYSPITDPYFNATKEVAVQIMLANLAKYEQFVASASNQDVQIIVFPEDGLYGIFGGEWGDPTRQMVFPYLEDLPETGSFISDPALPVLSTVCAMARKYGVIIVMTMGDLKYCSEETDPNCPSDGRYQFNTQIAVDETGKFVAKYHKTHLFFEPQFDPGTGRPSWFESSFGVKFGLLICFDIMFAHPALSLIDMGVFDFAYSIWWVDQPPILTGVQLQQQFSALHKVNVLSSNSGQGFQYSGSSIMTQGTPLAYYYNPTSAFENRMLVSRVPIIARGNANMQKKKKKLEREVAKETEHFQFIAPNITYAAVKPGGSYCLTSTHRDYLFCEACWTMDSKATNVGTMALVSYAGLYFDAYYEQLCSLVVCSEAKGCYDPTWRTQSVLNESLGIESFSVRSIGGSPGMTFYSFVLGQDGQPVFPTTQYVLENNAAQKNSSLTSTKTFAPQQTMGMSIFSVFLA